VIGDTRTRIGLALIGSQLALYSQELPVARDALESMCSPLGEADVRSSDEVGDGSGNQHLVGLGKRLDAGSRVHGDTL